MPPELLKLAENGRSVEINQDAVKKLGEKVSDPKTLNTLVKGLNAEKKRLDIILSDKNLSPDTLKNKTEAKRSIDRINGSVDSQKLGDFATILLKNVLPGGKAEIGADGKLRITTGTEQQIAMSPEKLAQHNEREREKFDKQAKEDTTVQKQTSESFAALKPTIEPKTQPVPPTQTASNTTGKNSLGIEVKRGNMLDRTSAIDDATRK